MIPAIEALGIGMVPYSPLGRGFLTGKIDENATFDSTDFRNALPRFTPEALKANQALILLLGSIAQRKNATPAQIALGWLLAQKPVDRSDPRYHEAASPGREYRCNLRRTHARRSAKRSTVPHRRSLCKGRGIPNRSNE